MAVENKVVWVTRLFLDLNAARMFYAVNKGRLTKGASNPHRMPDPRLIQANGGWVVDVPVLRDEMPDDGEGYWRATRG